MKKILLMAVCIIMMSMTASGLTINKVLLDHNGEVTLFDGDNIQDAVNAAVDGDVVYLTLGTFKPFNIAKKITIRGTGETSVIDGDVNISIPNAPTLVNPVLETLSITGSVSVTTPLTNLYVRQCKISSGFSIGAAVTGSTIERCRIGSMSFSGAIKDLLIDRCSTGLTLSSTIESMTVTNCYINSLSASTGATNNTTFVNSNLYFSNCTNFSGTIINSIVERSANTVYLTINSTVLVNSLINNHYSYVSIGASSVCQNCYIVSSDNLDISTSALQARLPRY